ncbi:SLATT domain-containing protein [Bacillus cereus]|nr:SLATT domain-containing protein [Bacillus cereus]
MTNEEKIIEQVNQQDLQSTVDYKNKGVTEIDIFKELKRRVDLTRRSRIKAADRLRERHEFFEKVSYFYSVVVLALSVWFITGNNGTTKILLIASLSLTFFTMFLGVKNYKERASNFENNYQQLNMLLNKLQRLEGDLGSVNQDKLKELHRDFEKLILEKENHINIDYITCNSDHELKYQNKIMIYKLKDGFVRYTVLILPLIVLIISLYLNK